MLLRFEDGLDKALADRRYLDIMMNHDQILRGLEDKNAATGQSGGKEQLRFVT